MHNISWLEGFDVDINLMNKSFNVKDINVIYEHLVDERSKRIFTDRLMYVLTGNYNFILDVIENSVFSDPNFQKLKEYDEVAVFGAGTRGQRFVSVFTSFKFSCFIDNYKDEGIKIRDIPVYHLDSFVKRYSGIPVVVSISPYSQSCEIVCEQLIEAGIPEDLIYNLKNWECDMQYFDFFERDSSVKEVFIDAGAFDGSTIKSFLNWCSGDYERIIAFEPDEENYKKASGLTNLENYSILKKGLYSKKKKVYFSAESSCGSKILDDGKNFIDVVDLDSIVNEDRVTFIKMDIEGSELEAIKGSQNLLATQKPKLAISIYHKPEDIIEIPKLLLEINPDYNFGIRHYSFYLSDTILYAY